MYQLETTLSQQLNNNQMNQNLGYHEMVKTRKAAEFVSQQYTEKMKASNFPASVLRIGSWEVKVQSSWSFKHFKIKHNTNLYSYEWAESV